MVSGENTHICMCFLMIRVCVCKFACAKNLSHLLKIPFTHVHLHRFLFRNTVTKDDREQPPRPKKVSKRSDYDSDSSESVEGRTKKQRGGRSEQNIPQIRGRKSPSVSPTSYQNRSRSHQVSPPSSSKDRYYTDDDSTMAPNRRKRSGKDKKRSQPPKKQKKSQAPTASSKADKNKPREDKQKPVQKNLADISKLSKQLGLAEDATMEDIMAFLGENDKIEGNKKTQKSAKKKNDKKKKDDERAKKKASAKKNAARAKKDENTDSDDEKLPTKPKKSSNQVPKQDRAPLILALKNHGWRKQTFVKNGTAAVRMAKKICQKTGYKQWTQAKDPKADENIKKYVDLYWSGISSLLNELRNSINGKIKDVATAYMTQRRADGVMGDTGLLPPLAELKKIMLRKPDLNMDLFVWWWEKVLPAAVGISTHWDDKVYNYVTISEHRAKRDDGGEPTMADCYVSPVVEAYAYFCFENNYQKWMTCFDIQSKHLPGLRVRLRKSMSKCKGDRSPHFNYVTVNAGNHEIFIAYGKKQDSKPHYPMQTLYSDANAGQKVCGGFHDGAINTAIGYAIACG